MTTCDGCWYASERARETASTVECVCGATYPTLSVVTRLAPAPDEPPAPVAYAPRERPPLPPDARVSVSHSPSPSSAPPVARLTHVEDAELVEVREVLCELRPDRSGPLGWAPDGEAPSPAGSSWTPTLRGGSSEVPAILPGAFASTAPASKAPDLDHGFYELGDEVRATLRWMQRSGTLKQGLRALYQACALSSTISTTEQRDAWAAMAEGVRTGARVVFGRKRVREAVAAWRAPTATATPAGEGASVALALGERASATASATGEALARVRGRMGMAVGEGVAE